jgi:hypothetical protein
MHRLYTVLSLISLYSLGSLPAYSASESCKGCVSAQQTQTFLDFIATLEKAEPIVPQHLERLIGQKPDCGDPKYERIDCSTHGITLGGVKVKDIDFRSNRNNGSIFILNLREGDCLSVDAFDTNFGKGNTFQSCTDGVTCIYRAYTRPWGRVSLGLGDNVSNTCVKSVILDSTGGK